MFESISGLKVKGGCFKNTFDFMPFSRKVIQSNGQITTQKPKTIGIVYGKNGSGKSSLTQALYEYKHGLSVFSQIELINDDKQVIDKSTFNLDRIYIFNEEFIKQNVRINSDEKLAAIVLLGETVTLDDRVQILENRAEKIEIVSSKFEKDLEKLQDKKNPNSPDIYKQRIKNYLTTNWAEQERKIKGSRRAADVSANVINNFIQAQIPLSSIESLKNDFNLKYSELEKIKENVCIDEPLVTFKLDDSIDPQVNNLLKKSIEKPIFNEREQAIITMLETQKDTKRINEIKEFFSISEHKHCSFCFQPITQDYRNELLSSISKVFDSHEAQSHRIQLDDFVIETISKDLEKYKVIDDELVEKIKDLIEEYNKHISNIIEKIELKKTNIYTPITNFTSATLIKLQNINILINSLENKRNSFNGKIKSPNLLINTLQKLNKEIAICAISDDKELYLQQNKVLEKTQHKNTQCKRITLNLIKRIESLNSRKASIDLAIPVINQYLSYIFFSQDRLSIELDGNQYAVKSRGNKVLLSRLSEGEKNAIALCYFFSKIASNKKLDEFFDEESFVILDDPISSFDFNNKIGIYSFLRLILRAIHRANPNSRTLIFTHQIEVVFHLEKACADVVSEMKQDPQPIGGKINVKLSFLENQKLFPFESKNYNEYSKLLNKIFLYADQEGIPESDDSIGNSMRKVLEGFGTFNYKKGIDELSTHPEILKLIDGEHKQNHFKSLMYRLVLNSESHYEDQARIIPEIDFFQFISSEEKQQTAKQILIFLKLINKLHLKFHLNNDAISKIEQWEAELFP